MAISDKYGTLDIPKIADDEPVFILRAQDQLAAAAIEIYRILAAYHAAPNTASIEEAIEKFKNWDGIKKLPD